MKLFSYLNLRKGFHENFENPDSVVSSGNPGWALYSQVQTSGFFCDSTTAAPGDSSMLTTISFSTVGLYHIILKFNDIVTFESGAGIVEGNLIGIVIGAALGGAVVINDAIVQRTFVGSAAVAS